MGNWPRPSGRALLSTSAQLGASVIELPDSTVFAAVLYHSGFVAAALVTVIAAGVRGFSGFGSALIYVPLIAALYDPRASVASLTLVDLVCAAPLAVRVFRQCHWREVLPAAVAAVATAPLGIALLDMTDPAVLRWTIAISILIFVALLATGWRYPWKQSTPAALGVGALSGICGGAAQIGGPPLILYWLGSPDEARTIRANLLVFLVLLDLVLLGGYTWHGVMTAQAIALAVLLGPFYILALVVGARLFRRSSDRFYRRIAYAIVTLAALASMPVFDKILH